MSASPFNPLRPARLSRAFTLLELMVSVALLAVIIIGLLAMFTQVQRAWKSGITQVDVMEGGRAAMALIVRDLQEMVPVPTTNSPASPVPMTLLTNLWVSNSQYSATTELDLVDGSVRTNFLQDISFLVRSGDQWNGIAYRIDDATATIGGIGTLYRLVASTPVSAAPQAILDHYRGFPTNVHEMSLSNILVTLDSSLPLTLPAFASTDFHRVVDGVVNLTFTLFDTNGQEMIDARIYAPGLPARPGYVCTNVFVLANGVINFVGQLLPAYVEVELAVAEPVVAERFRIRAESNPQAARDYLKRKAGQVHVFRQRVPIRPAATTVGPLLPGS